MKHRWRLAWLVVAALLAGCGSNHSTFRSYRLQVVNLAPDTQPFRVLKNGEAVANLTTGSNNLLGVYQSSRLLEVTEAAAEYRSGDTYAGYGPSDALYFTTTVPGAANVIYSLRLVSQTPANSPTHARSVVAVTEPIPAANATGAGLRAMNASQLGLALDVVFRYDAAPNTEVPIGTNLAFGEVSGVADGVSTATPIDVASGTIIVRRADTGAALLTQPYVPATGVISDLAVVGTTADESLAIVKW